MDILDYLLAMDDAPGVTGTESSFDAPEKLLAGSCDRVFRDAPGNIVGVMEGESPAFLLDAHADRIGLIVTGFAPGGFLRVARCGGTDRRVLPAAEVTVWGKRPVTGVITSTPPHLIKDDDENKAPDYDGIFVDTGLTDGPEETVCIGDRVSINGTLRELPGGRVTGAALDDRLGIAVLLRAAALLREAGCRNRVEILCSAQEEVTGTGAATGAYASDAEYAIAVDVSFALAPEIKESECGVMGKGAMVCIAPSLSRELTDRVLSAAREKEIAYQLEVSGGRTGTNADDIAASKYGKRTALISVPIRNMHTQAELAQLSDAEACARLIAETILSVSSPEVKS